MESVDAFITPPAPCEYLPHQTSRMVYTLDHSLRARQYDRFLRAGWRRFGAAVFRPECPSCARCQSVRIPVETFRLNESQRRAWRRNAAEVTLTVGTPTSTPERQALYTRFHAQREVTRGWTPADDDNLDAFVENPFPTEEWTYRIDGRLVGVGYVDALPSGLSAIYFFWDPAEQPRSLGTFNVLRIVEAARERGLPHVYLGYYVEGCGSLEYKARFRPNEVLGPDGWRPFR